MTHDEDHLRHDAEKLLRQSFALACLVNVKVKDKKRDEDQRIKENMELHKEVERLQDDVNHFSGLQQKVERLWTEANCQDVALAEKTQEALSLDEEKRELSNEVEDLKKKVTCKEEDLTKTTETFKQDATQSYLVAFKNALE